MPAQDSLEKAHSAAWLLRKESFLSFLLIFPLVLGRKWIFSSSPSPPNGENLSLCIYYPSLELFIQINLRAEAEPGVIPWKTRKFSEPNGSNYRGSGSELFLESDMSGR